MLLELREDLIGLYQHELLGQVALKPIERNK
jgi:hypothetical protein